MIIPLGNIDFGWCLLVEIHNNIYGSLCLFLRSQKKKIEKKNRKKKKRKK